LSCLIIFSGCRLRFFKKSHDAIFLRYVVNIREWSVVLHDYVIAVGGIAEIVGNPFFWVVRGAKHIIHKIKFTREILINCLWVVGVMPAMKFRITYDIAQPMRIFNIAVAIPAPKVSE